MPLAEKGAGLAPPQHTETRSAISAPHHRWPDWSKPRRQGGSNIEAVDPPSFGG